MIVRLLPILLAGLGSASWLDGETVSVQSVGTVNLAPFACQDITRSSIVSRVCYDRASRRMIVESNAAWSQYCGVPEVVRDGFVNAPSMGRYYNANIKGSEEAGSYQCHAQRLPER
jgi:hypothetical protein